MKKILLLFALCFYCLLGEAQQHSIQMGMNLVEANGNAKRNVSLSWNIEDGVNSGYGVRLNYGTSEEEGEYYYRVNTKLLYLDVSKRWHTSLERKVIVNAELGISGMLRNESYDDYFYFFCGTVDYGGPMAHRAKEYGGRDYTFRDKEYALFFLPGASVGTGVDFNMTTRFYFGLQARLNAYYWSESKKVLPYFQYGLSAGYRF